MEQAGNSTHSVMDYYNVRLKYLRSWDATRSDTSVNCWRRTATSMTGSGRCCGCAEKPWFAWGRRDVMVQEYGRYVGMPTCYLRGGCLTGPNHSGVELHGFLSCTLS